MRKALYAFSGDPITYGHIDIVERTSRAFDNVIAAIGANPDKKYTFNLDERTEMAKKSLSRFNNVEVVSFKGMLVDYAYENKVDIIVKGVRNSADVDYEKNLHQVGESQKFGIDTHILFARPELAHISSSTVKSMQKEQGMIHEFVPPYVKQCLEERISGQYIVGVTGEIGVGKSYVSRKFIEIANARGIPAHNIELDYVGHKILGELKEPIYDEVRSQIADIFGKNLRKEDGTIDRKALGEIVFNDIAALHELNEIMEKPLLMRLRRELYDKKGLILFNAALIAESDMSYLCNNNAVIVYADKKTQISRIARRGLSPEQIQRRLASQFDFETKKYKIQEAIDKDNNGKTWIVDTSEGKDEIETIFDQVISDMKVK